jgi:GNAT superfamily N-acetyltransferase
MSWRVDIPEAAGADAREAALDAFVAFNAANGYSGASRPDTGALKVGGSRRMAWRIEVAEAPGPAEREAVLAPLADFNAASGYPGDARPVALLLRDEGERIVGGLWGRTGYGWLFVEFLVVPEALRGRAIGTRLMDEAERIATARGCVGAWLTTFPFQARGFYEKRGYALFGELENSPGDNVRLFLSKRL